MISNQPMPVVGTFVPVAVVGSWLPRELALPGCSALELHRTGTAAFAFAAVAGNAAAKLAAVKPAAAKPVAARGDYAAATRSRPPRGEPR